MHAALPYANGEDMTQFVVKKAFDIAVGVTAEIGDRLPLTIEQAGIYRDYIELAPIPQPAEQDGEADPAAAGEVESVGENQGVAAPDSESDGPTYYNGLIGSSVLTGTVKIKKKGVALGDIVGAAFAASQLTVEQWNELPENDREERLLATIEAMKAA